MPTRAGPELAHAGDSSAHGRGCAAGELGDALAAVVERIHTGDPTPGCMRWQTVPPTSVWPPWRGRNGEGRDGGRPWAEDSERHPGCRVGTHLWVWTAANSGETMPTDPT